ncbi:MAG: DUF6785 family protein [bacterium]
MRKRSSDAKSGVTLRAIVLGLLLIPANAYWIAKAEIVWATIHATVLSIFFNVIFSLFFLSVLNIGLKRFFSNFAFTPAELLTIYVILCIATSLFGHDMLQILIPLMSYAFWFATPENGWKELFWGYLPRWLVIDDREILKGYYEGETNFYNIHIISAWINPILIWLGFVIILYFTMICILTFIRRRWTEEEKLNYPIIQLPYEMAVNSSRFFRNKTMWIGFAISASLDLIHGLHRLYPFIPDFNTKIDIAPFFSERPWNAIGWMPVCFYPFVIGLAYFMPLDLSFSTWFFYLFWKAQLVIREAFGLARMSGPYLGDQSAGAWVGLGVLSIWLSRRSIFKIIRAVFSRNPPDDSDEPLPYRFAFFGLISGIIVLSIFSWAAGMSIWVAFIFFMLYFVIVLAATRMRAELGPPTHDLYFEGPDRILTSTLGTRRLSPNDLSIFALYFWITRDYRCHPMPHQLEGFKLAERTGFKSRRLVIAIMLATVVGTLATFWTTLSLFYEFGASSRTRGYVLGLGWEAYNRLQNWLDYPSGPNVEILGQMGFGLGLTIFLMIMRRIFLGFPFHPVGYAVAGSWTMSWMWFSVMLSWIIKYILIKSGGLKPYRKALPFFLGLMLGQFISGSLWSLYGAITDKLVYGFFV